MDKLLQNVGLKCPKYDLEGNYIECFAPLYLIDNSLPKFKESNLPKDLKQQYKFLIKLFEKYCKKIQLENAQPKDIILFRHINKLPHLAIYIGDYKIFHYINGELEITRLKNYKHSILGVFRLCQQ